MFCLINLDKLLLFFLVIFIFLIKSSHSIMNESFFETYSINKKDAYELS